MAPSFEELLARAKAAPIEGWDFSWLAGRATEERPSWRYSEIVAERAKLALRMLDLQTACTECPVCLDVVGSDDQALRDELLESPDVAVGMAASARTIRVEVNR
jgi:hypothetical protein